MYAATLAFRKEQFNFSQIKENFQHLVRFFSDLCLYCDLQNCLFFMLHTLLHSWKKNNCFWYLLLHLYLAFISSDKKTLLKTLGDTSSFPAFLFCKEKGKKNKGKKTVPSKLPIIFPKRTLVQIHLSWSISAFATSVTVAVWLWGSWQTVKVTQYICIKAQFMQWGTEARIFEIRYAS